MRFSLVPRHWIYTLKRIGLNESKPIYDLRSDTVTIPTPEMREWMLKAKVGDNVFDEDPTVDKLEQLMAQMTGCEAALYCASGTMSNQLAILAHSRELPFSIVCDARSHIYKYEASGLSFHARAHVIPLNVFPSKHMTMKLLESNCILSTDIHVAKTRLICLENTLNGEILNFLELQRMSNFAKSKNISIHLDGARLWNASVATQIPLDQYGQYVDSASLCFSKGLGAPIGSVLVGRREFIQKAKHFRKMMGGGWRQAGILASACLYSIDQILPKLHRDHELAQRLALGLQDFGYQLVYRTDTNMVWLDLSNVSLDIEKIQKWLIEHNIRIADPSDSTLRFVIHHQIDQDAIDFILQAFNKQNHPNPLKEQ